VQSPKGWSNGEALKGSPGNGEASRVWKEGKFFLTVSINSQKGDKEMVNSRALLNNYSSYFTLYTFIPLLLPCGLLSLINIFFPKNISADGFGNNMSNHLNIKVINFSSESFLRFPNLMLRKQERGSRKGVLNFSSKR